MDLNVIKQYASKDITIFRAKSLQRSQGDGEEHKTLTMAVTSSSLNNNLEQVFESIVPKQQASVVQYKTRRSKDLINSSERLSNHNILPDISNVAKKLNKVSLFTAPDPLFLSAAPIDLEKKEKFIMMPTEALTAVKKYSFSTKKKEPKFVPYEPYKGCVKPILARSLSRGYDLPPVIEQAKETKIGSNVNLERSSSTSCVIDNHGVSEKLQMMISDFEKERSLWELKNYDLQLKNETLERELLQLQKDQAVLQQQLSTQSQVNFELKKLLVASVGEDVQGRVQCLTEDKARMATMIRKYSEKVDKDYEEKEKMSIHCDVLRSKFLASSLLIDELARWKGMLLQRFESSKEALKLMLGERDVAHHNIINFYRHTYQVREAFDPLHAEGGGIGIVDSSDIVSLSVASANMAENIKDRLLGSIGRAIGSVDLRLPSETLTAGEKLAMQILEDDLNICESLIPYAATPGRGALKPRYHPNANFEHLTVNCCRNCNGDIKVV